MEQLSDFFAEQQQITIPDEEVQWHVWVVPDFDKDHSLMIWKSQHVIIDGIGALCAFGTLCGEYDPSNYIQTSSPIPLWKQIIINLLKPLTAFGALMYHVFQKKDKNCIKLKADMPLAGFKKNAICKPMSVPVLK